MTCQNCNSALSCGCQKKIASDGTKVCANCISAYEKSINGEISLPKELMINTQPSNVKVIYTPPKNIDSL